MTLVHVFTFLLSRNPMGRTGVRGRGALVRWGPNKSIMAVITRWKRHRGQFAIVDGQRLLEALVFKDKYSNDWKLPGVSPDMHVDSLPHSVSRISFFSRERYSVWNRRTVPFVAVSTNLPFKMKTRNIAYRYRNAT